EMREQLDEPQAVQPLRVDLVPEGAAGVDRRDGAHTLPTATRWDLWRLPAQAPRAPQHLVGAHAGLVEEEDRGLDALGAGAQARKHRLGPPLDRLGIALV